MCANAKVCGCVHDGVHVRMQALVLRLHAHAYALENAYDESVIRSPTTVLVVRASDLTSMKASTTMARNIFIRTRSGQEHLHQNQVLSKK